MLDSMLLDLSKHKRNRDELMHYYVNMRLSKSLEVYYKELSENLDYLAGKNGLRVLRQLNRMSGG